MRDELFHVNRSACDEIEKGLDVASLGPANICEWIIVSTLLVLRIVAARTIGHRDRESELFFEVVGSRNVHTDEADNDDASFDPRDLAGELDRFVGSSARRDDHGIRTPAA
jgi:hypothetical protein